MGMVKIDGDVLLPHIAELLLSIDKAFALATKSKGELDTIAEVDSGVLDFYQDLLEARQTSDGEYAMKKLSLPTLPRKHGVESVTFDGGNGDFFEFRPTLVPV